MDFVLQFRGSHRTSRSDETVSIPADSSITLGQLRSQYSLVGFKISHQSGNALKKNLSDDMLLRHLGTGTLCIYAGAYQQAVNKRKYTRKSQLPSGLDALISYVEENAISSGGGACAWRVATVNVLEGVKALYKILKQHVENPSVTSRQELWRMYGGTCLRMAHLMEIFNVLEKPIFATSPIADDFKGQCDGILAVLQDIGGFHVVQEAIATQRAFLCAQREGLATAVPELGDWYDGATAAVQEEAVMVQQAGMAQGSDSVSDWPTGDLPKHFQGVAVIESRAPQSSVCCNCSRGDRLEQDAFVQNLIKENKSLKRKLSAYLAMDH